jgi:hypothetical protein
MPIGAMSSGTDQLKMGVDFVALNNKTRLLLEWLVNTAMRADSFQSEDVLDVQHTCKG